MDPETQRINYRIAFDAMRAYHKSEIEHKRDMITILNGILFSVITLYAGIFYFTLSNDFNYLFSPNSQINIRVIFYIIFILIPFIYFYVINRLKKTNIKKVKSDNNRYEKFRSECIVMRDELGINKFLKSKNLNTDVIYWETELFDQNIKDNDREGSGHQKTISIINSYSNLIIGMVFLLAILSIFFLNSRASFIEGESNNHEKAFFQKSNVEKVWIIGNQYFLKELN